MTLSDTTALIQRSALKFFSGTMLSRMTGYLRDVALAYSFGTDPLLASFLVAFRFAHLARRLFGEGSLQNVFIPHFEELRKKDPAQARSFFRDTSFSLALFIALLSLGIALALSPFLSNEIVLLTCLMLPSLLFICLFGLNAALLECEKSYFLPSIAPVAFNLVWIVAALSLGAYPVAEAVKGLSLAVIAACFFQWAVTVPSLIKNTSWTFWKQARAFSPDVRALVKPLLLANIGVAASQINNAVDPLFALYANSEGPAWLWYAIRLQQLPLALFGVAMTGALLPPLSRAIKAGLLQQGAEFFHFALKRLALLTIPISFLIVPTALNAIALLFGHGSFQYSSIENSAFCLLFYGMGIFPMAHILISAPALYAFKDYRSPTLFSILCMGANVLLNALFIFVLGFGAASVAAATSIAAFLNAALLHRLVEQKMGAQPTIRKEIVQMCLASSLGLVAVFYADYMVWGSVPAWDLLLGETPWVPEDTINQMGALLRETGIFAGVTGGILAWQGFLKKA